jgi:hypothetical protein
MDDSTVVLSSDASTRGSITLRNGDSNPYRFDRDMAIIADGRRAASMKFIDAFGTTPLFTIGGGIQITGILEIGTTAFSKPVVLEGEVSGSGVLRLMSGGAISVMHANSYSGGTSISRSVAVGNSLAFGTGKVWIEPESTLVSLEAKTTGVSLQNAVEFVPRNGAGTIVFSGVHPLRFDSTFVSLAPCPIQLDAIAPLSLAGGFVNHVITTTGTGTLNLAWYRGRGINAQGGRINFMPGSHATTSRAESLIIASAATVDLNDHALVIHAGGGSLGGAAGVRSLLAAGRLISSMAIADPSCAVGYGAAGDVLGIAPGDAPEPFFDQLVRDHDVLIRYTLAGDANLDGAVNLDDFTRLAGGFGSPDALWPQGDFDYDGTVALDDFTRLAANFGQTASRAVPEPAAATLFIAIAARACRRGRFALSIRG